MLQITQDIALEDSEIRFDFIRASGPGGQKVNKTSSAVQLRFDAARSPSLPEYARRRLLKIAGRRVSAQGVLIIEAKRFRSQDQNRQDALDRLQALVRRAAEKPRRRLPTAPSSVARERRITEKKKRSRIKQQRSRPEDSEDG